MKKGKALVLFLTALLLLFAAPGANGILAADTAGDPAAEEAFQVYLDGYKTTGTTFTVYLNHNQSPSFIPSAEDITAKLGKTEMKTLNVSRFSDIGEPVTYLCVVDVSGSMDQKRIDEAKTIIKDLAGKKKASDNLCITALGNELKASGYKTDAAEIAAAADTLTVTGEDTNLYYAISEELKELQTSNEVHDKKCLLIFSDGADDQATGITREEAETAVKDSHIPVFTVGLLKSADNDNSKEMAKILGSFARISSGGIHFAPALKEGADGTIADSVLSRLNSSLVVEEDLSEVEISGKEVLLQIEVRNGDKTAQDKVSIPESDAEAVEEAIIRIEEEKKKETEVPVLPDNPEPAPVAENDPGSAGGSEAEIPASAADTILGLPKTTFFIIAGAAAAAVVVLIIVIVAVANNRKKNQEGTGYAPEVPESAPEQFGMMGAGDNSVTQGFGEDGPAGRTMGLSDPLPDAGTGKGWALTLTEVGKKDGKIYQIRVADTCTIGRSAARAGLPIPEDNALSGLHATLIRRENRLYLRDEKSMNGTFVNGVPISGEFELHQDDIVLMGSYEYRVSWEEK